MKIFEKLSSIQPVLNPKSTSNVTHNLLELMADSPDGIMFYANTSAALLQVRGVRKPISLCGIDEVIALTKKEDCIVTLFNKKYNFKVRGNSFFLIRHDFHHELSVDIGTNIRKFCDEIVSGGGLSFVGSSNPIIIYPLLKQIIGNIDGSVLTIFKVEDYYLCKHHINHDRRKSISIKFTDLDSAIEYIKSCPLKVIIIEIFSGIKIKEQALDIAKKGKTVICAKNDFSSVYSLHEAMSLTDRELLSSLFNGALFIDSLPLIKGANCPRLPFEEHPGYAKWAPLKTSPTKAELVKKDPRNGIHTISTGNLWLSELISPSKVLSRWIAENVSATDIISNLRLGGWLSIADEAAIASRDGLVTFDSVMKEITLI